MNNDNLFDLLVLEKSIHEEQIGEIVRNTAPGVTKDERLWHYIADNQSNHCGLQLDSDGYTSFLNGKKVFWFHLNIQASNYNINLAQFRWYQFTTPRLLRTDHNTWYPTSFWKLRYQLYRGRDFRIFSSFQVSSTVPLQEKIISYSFRWSKSSPIRKLNARIQFF